MNPSQMVLRFLEVSQKAACRPSLKSRVFLLSTLLVLVGTHSLAADEPSLLSHILPAHPHSESSQEAVTDGQTTLDHVWMNNAVGATFDIFGGQHLYYFHEPTNSDLPAASGIWRVPVNNPGAATQFIYSKLGGQDVDGGAVRPSDGALYVADYNGDLTEIGDNIHLFDRSGNILAFWETDLGLAGTPCSGPAINRIVDVAIDPENPGVLYATAYQDPNIYRIDVSDTSGGALAPSPCTVTHAFTPPAEISDPAGLGYDRCGEGYWISDFSSSNVVLTSGPPDFSVRITYNGSVGGNGGRTSGLAPIPRINRTDLWLVDLDDQQTAALSTIVDGCGTSTGGPF